MKYIISATVLSILIGCNSKHEPKSEIQPLLEVFEAYYQDIIKLNPLYGNFLGSKAYMDTIPNTLSPEYPDRQNEVYQKYLGLLEEYDRESLSREERLNFDVLVWHCQTMLKQDLKLTTYLPINQFSNSIHNLMPYFGSGNAFIPFNTKTDYENWLSRLEDYAMLLDQALINMQEGIAMGYKQPKTITKKLISQLEAVANQNLETHPFYKPIVNMSVEISRADSLKLARSYAKMIMEELNPTYQKLIDFLKTEYAANPRTTAGIKSLPDSEAAYQGLIQLHTSTNLSADSIFNLGLHEVKRIKGEMAEVLKNIGYEGSLEDYYDLLQNERFKPFTEPQQVIDYYQEIHQRMLPKLAILFDKKPKTSFEIRRVPDYQEKNSGHYYMAGSVDGSNPGVFFVPVPNASNYSVVYMESLFLHEGIPGHHYERMLALENEYLPEFRKFTKSGAFVEGWALYAESLGSELGLYRDPYNYFGMLNGELHRAIRLVLDVGLHAKGWTREEAIAYSLAQENITEENASREVERYMSNPGQALSYKIGQLTILALRAKAENELREKFDIKEFHSTILENGSLPLSVLEQYVHEWIEMKKAEV